MRLVQELRRRADPATFLLHAGHTRHYAGMSACHSAQEVHPLGWDKTSHQQPRVCCLWALSPSSSRNDAVAYCLEACVFFPWDKRAPDSKVEIWKWVDFLWTCYQNSLLSTHADWKGWNSAWFGWRCPFLLMFWLCFLLIIDAPQTSRPSALGDLSAGVPLFITQVCDECVCQLLDRKQ